jgi:hypothetical protein
MTTPSNGGNGPVETKVTVAGVAAAITTFIMGYILTGSDTFDSVAAPLRALILAAVTGALTFGAAYWAKHTNRTDPKAQAAKHV